MLLAGCPQSVDLSAVRAFSETVGASSPAFADISGDFYGSCVREYDWLWAGALNHRGVKTLDITCAEQQAAAQQWQKANLVVIAYVQGLGNVAGGGDTQTDFAIPDLISGITSVTSSKLTDAQVNAIGSFGTSIVTDIFNLRRHNEIARYAPQANHDLDELISTLEDIARKNYAFQLALEQDAMDRFYAAVVPPPEGVPPVGTALPGVQELQARLGRSDKKGMSNQQARSALFDRVLLDIDRVQILTLKQSYLAERKIVTDKRKAIVAYVGALESIRKTHGQLVGAIESGRPNDIGKIAQAYTDEYAAQIKAIESAFAQNGSMK